MANLVTVKKRKNFDHIVGEETEQEFTLSVGYHEKLAQDTIYEAIVEYELFHGENVSESDEFNNANALNLVEGEYELDTGDFTYYITIE